MSRPFAILALWMFAFSPLGLAQAAFIHLAIPVTWQLTHTRLIGPATPSLTESFRETWWLEVSPSGLLLLSSPRAKVVAYALDGYESRGLVPRRAAVTEIDFARLVGVQPGVETEEIEALSATSKPIFLSLGHIPRGGVNINLIWSDEETYTVHFEVGADKIY